MGANSDRGRSGIPSAPEGLPSTCLTLIPINIGFLPANSKENPCAVIAVPVAVRSRILVSIF